MLLALWPGSNESLWKLWGSGIKKRRRRRRNSLHRSAIRNSSFTGVIIWKLIPEQNEQRTWEKIFRITLLVLPLVLCSISFALLSRSRRKRRGSGARFFLLPSSFLVFPSPSPNNNCYNKYGTHTTQQQRHSLTSLLLPSPFSFLLLF